LGFRFNCSAKFTHDIDKRLEFGVTKQCGVVECGQRAVADLVPHGSIVLLVEELRVTADGPLQRAVWRRQLFRRQRKQHVNGDDVTEAVVGSRQQTGRRQEESGAEATKLFVRRTAVRAQRPGTH